MTRSIRPGFLKGKCRVGDNNKRRATAASNTPDPVDDGKKAESPSQEHQNSPLAALTPPLPLSPPLPNQAQGKQKRPSSDWIRLHLPILTLILKLGLNVLLLLMLVEIMVMMMTMTMVMTMMVVMMRAVWRSAMPAVLTMVLMMVVEMMKMAKRHSDGAADGSSTAEVESILGWFHLTRVVVGVARKPSLRQFVHLPARVETLPRLAVRLGSMKLGGT